MQDSTNMTILGELVGRLRTADTRFRVFGSEQHRYKLGRKLSEAELRAFEIAHGVSLPEDYREFLAKVGNGGAGPYYGLEPLGTFGHDLSRPFPLTVATDGLTEEELEQLPDMDDYPGVLEFCHLGCAIYAFLVVNGSSYGTIWYGREDFHPSGLSFATWYRRWVERALRAIENERLVPRLRVGMSKADVAAEVGGDWQAREKAGQPGVWYFEASDFPAQLELDEHDFVIKVTPSPFIAAFP